MSRAIMSTASTWTSGATATGATLPPEHPGAFQNAMEAAFYGPLGELTVPESQRWFATADRLPHYAERIGELKVKGAELIVIFGIGRVCHIAFWEPHFAEEYATLDEWKPQTHRIGARLHPLTIEQNALTSFKSRMTLVPRSPTRSARVCSSPPIGSSAAPRGSSTAACSGRAPASG